MLISLLEISFYALLTAFCVARGVALLDFLLDYKQYWWKVRFNLAVKAATKVGMLDYLNEALEEAKQAEEGQADIMHSAYNEIADAYHPFKLWVCICCLTIRLSAIVVVPISLLLIYQGYGVYTVAYFFATMACVSWFLKI